jgi:hypothetical protein
MVRRLTFGLLAARLVSGNYETFVLRYSADPAPLVHDGRLYVYTSHDTVGQAGWLMTDYNVISTTDCVNWQDHGIAFSIKNTTWGKWAWAQQVTEVNGTFYMYFPAMSGGNDVGVAVSTSPLGPFVDALGHGIAPGDDPTIFIDDDGAAYLCTSSGGPLCGRLHDDLLDFAAPPAQLTIDGFVPGLVRGAVADCDRFWQQPHVRPVLHDRRGYRHVRLRHRIRDALGGSGGGRSTEWQLYIPRAAAVEPAVRLPARQRVTVLGVRV